MKFSKLFFLFAIMNLNSVHARLETTGPEDVLSKVAQKLTQVEKHLKDQRVYVNTATFEWRELNEFREEMMFVVAHDPVGAIPKETPAELHPTQLSIRLRLVLAKLEASAFQMGNLMQGEEWGAFKTDIEQFLTYRDEYLYVPARGMIRSGQLHQRITKLKDAATAIFKGSSDTKNISVRVIDPVIEDLSREMNVLNQSVRQLEDFRKPRPVEIKTIFQEKNILELVYLSLGAIAVGFFITIFGQWVSKFFAKKEPVVQQAPVKNSFDYSDWLKKFESSLHTFKNSEDNLIEDHIHLKNLGHDLMEARKGLNLADNQQDFYICLDRLNETASKIEGYFEKLNLKKNSEISRKLVKSVVQLCNAIENRQEIALPVQQTKLKIVKNEQEGEIKAA